MTFLLCLSRQEIAIPTVDRPYLASLAKKPSLAPLQATYLIADRLRFKTKVRWFDSLPWQTRDAIARIAQRTAWPSNATELMIYRDGLAETTKRLDIFRFLGAEQLAYATALVCACSDLHLKRDQFISDNAQFQCLDPHATNTIGKPLKGWQYLISNDWPWRVVGGQLRLAPLGTLPAFSQMLPLELYFDTWNDVEHRPKLGGNTTED